MTGFGVDASTASMIYDVLPKNARFASGELPFAYEDPYFAAKTKTRQEAEPALAPVVGVKVFDFTKKSDIDEMQVIVQQVAWGYCRFEAFNLQYDGGAFRAFVVWTMYQRMPEQTVTGMKQRAWEVIRRLHNGKR